ncbi:MAG TPA: hypothetical protein ENJ15_06900 [Caldithrix abyssi]|uniref:Glycerophosphoryl diester phosphodiesterase membrane domain-containing protein n=1 Tax=Caldithrix abyssi TaxID=187145 RepID=A0A7V5RQA8_CALAY|nr:hypothetical protein [Caldithrix abyssi]
MEQTTQLQKARNISETLNAAFSFLREQFIPLAKNLLYVAGPLIILSALLNYFFFSKIFGAMVSNPSDPATTFNLMFSPQYLLLMFTQVLVTTVIALIVNFYVLDYVEGTGPTSVARMWQLVLNKTPIFLVYNIVIFFLMMLGMMFFVLPGIYLAIALVLFIPAAIQENLGLGAAIKRSIHLIKNYWWFTLGLMLLSIIILYIVYVVIELPFMLLGVGAVFSAGSPFSMEEFGNMYGIYVAFAQLSMLIYAFIFLVETVHFYSQREKKEASGLSGQIAELESPVTE